MGAEEDQGAGGVGQADAHRALVTSGASHPSLDLVHQHIPEQINLDTEHVHDVVNDLINGARDDLTNTYRQTPTSCV